MLPGQVGGIPLVDTGNMLLSESVAQLVTAVVDSAYGQRLCLTIRTQTTTLTVLLNSADALVWSRTIAGGARELGSGLVVIGNDPRMGGDQNGG